MLKAFGTGKIVTNLLDKLKEATFKSMSVQKKATADALWKKMSEIEKIDTLKKAINKGDNQVKADVYYAI
jgi:anti-sigma28 factor (negative regulator of flagellin synthesis)